MLVACCAAIILLFAVAQNAQAGTTAPVMSIYGKIQVVDSFPDYKVNVVDSFPDLKVKTVSSFPDGPGKWQNGIGDPSAWFFRRHLWGIDQGRILEKTAG